jgi:nucleotide-binding universal stress UspA family protein
MDNSFAPKSVLVSTDHSAASRTAFAHALAFSLLGRADLTIFDAAGSKGANGVSSGPRVRSTLERWGLVTDREDGAARARDLGLRVRRVRAKSPEMLASMAEHIRQDRTELLVFGIRKVEPVPSWLAGLNGSDLSDLPLSNVMLVPHASPGFVSLRDGALTLRRIVIALDQGPDPVPALEAAARIAWSFSEWNAECQVLHMGGDDPRGYLPESEESNERWEILDVFGSKSRAIANSTRDADLLIMPVAAREGGQMLESILKGAVGKRARLSNCPVLLVPAERQATPAIPVAALEY